MTVLGLLSPSGVVRLAAPLNLAKKRLAALGYAIEVDPSARLKHQRFAGDDAARLDVIHRVARRAPDIAMPTRGGYGLTRLLDAIDWNLVGRSVDRGTRWVGHSDFTALQLGLLAHTGRESWAGPMACDDFGRPEPGPTEDKAATPGAGEPAVDEVTQACFVEAMSGELEAVGFRTDPGHDGLEARGTLWGGNLCIVSSLLGTPHWPRVKGGILFVEDVNEHPYRVERGLLQLAQAGVLDAQRAVLVGAVSGFRKSPLDRGYSVASMLTRVRAATRTPILSGLPFGHVRTKVTMPVGAKVQIVVDGRQAFVGWA